MKLRRFLVAVYIFCNVLLGTNWSEPELIPCDNIWATYLTVNNEGICWCEAWPWMYSYRDDELGWQPEIELDSNCWGVPCFDKENVLWLFHDNDLAIYYTCYDGENWGELDSIPVYPSANWAVHITADSSHGVWVAWTTDWWYYWRAAYNRYQNGEWGEPQPITDTLEYAEHGLHCLTTDVNGRVWAGWVKLTANPFREHIETAYFEGENWSDVITISSLEETSYSNLTLRPDHEGGMWALWCCREGYYMKPSFVLASHWDGEKWSEPDTVATAGYLAPSTQWPGGKVAVDSYGNVWAVWRQAVVEGDNTGDIYYSVNTDSGWSEPAPVSEHPAVDRWPDIAVDGAGRIWCVWSSNREGEDEYDYSIWASYTWGVGVKEPVTPQPPSTTIESIYPNPFQSTTTISYSVSGKLGSNKNQFVELKVFDVTGREVKTLVSDIRTPGHYEVFWNGEDNKGLQCSSGVYFVRMHSNEFNANERLILLK